MADSNVQELKPWETVEFTHFVGVRHRKGPWTQVILKPTGDVIDIEKTGKTVTLHDNGIEWMERR